MKTKKNESEREQTTIRLPIAKDSNQKYMDKLTVGFCEHLYVVNGFVTDIAAGHITRIGREADFARMPPRKGILTKQTLQK